MITTKTSTLCKRLFPKEKIKLKATNGKKTILEANDVFSGFMDPHLEKWRLNNQNQFKTKKTIVNIYQLVQNASFKEVFNSVNKNIDKICFTQNQIVEFCRNHRDRLHVLSNLFLFKENGRYFIASVGMNSDGLSVLVHSFDDEFVCNSYAVHFIIPNR